jgi:hypothetical protein
VGDAEVMTGLGDGDVLAEVGVSLGAPVGVMLAAALGCPL